MGEGSLIEQEVVPQEWVELGNGGEYFRTATAGTLLSTICVSDCIAGIFYRIGHIGLGHYKRDFDSILNEIRERALPAMLEKGEGDVYGMFSTGQSFAYAAQFQGEEGIERYLDYLSQIRAGGINFNETDSRTYILANEGEVYPIKRIEASLTGEQGDKVRVKIQYLPPESKPALEDNLAEFEIDMNTHKTHRILTPDYGAGTRKMSREEMRELINRGNEMARRLMGTLPEHARRELEGRGVSFEDIPPAYPLSESEPDLEKGLGIDMSTYKPHRILTPDYGAGTREMSEGMREQIACEGLLRFMSGERMGTNRPPREIERLKEACSSSYALHGLTQKEYRVLNKLIASGINLDELDLKTLRKFEEGED